MNQKTPQSLPLGNQVFSTLRKAGEIYVDKTALIAKLVAGRRKCFLARPRRFGKSLLISTLHSLFAYGTRDFKGLAVESLWHEKTYDVVTLDFSQIKDFSELGEFRASLNVNLLLKFEALGFESRWPVTSPFFLDAFFSWFSKRGEDSLVLLIDEYDAPLTQAIDDPVLFEGVRQVVSKFFSHLKANEACLHFLFLTGITRLRNTSIFSGFNNLTDLTLDPDYGELLGYTEAELETYFGAYLRKAEEIHGLDRQALLAKLREWYDGFSFDRKGATHVYCPWSVLSYFGDGNCTFDNYWYATGGEPTVLMKYLAKRRLTMPVTFEGEVKLDPEHLTTATAYVNMKPEVMLQQAGYLTIRKVAPSGQLLLGWPNREVASSMALLSLKTAAEDPYFSVLDIAEGLLGGHVASVVATLNSAFTAIHYNNFPVNSEAAFQMCLQLLFTGMSVRPQVEVPTNTGRSDLELDAGDYHWVFELKFEKADKNKSADQLLVEAEMQMVRHRYGMTPHGKALIRVALVFSESARQITAWKVV